MTQTAAIILAAGKGTRMKSELPKVLHPLCGAPMVSWVIRALSEVGIKQSCLVLGDDVQRFEPLMSGFPNVSVAIQNNRLGTGDAAAACAWSFAGVTKPSYASGKHERGEVIEADHVLICTGDIPAVGADQYKAFVDFCLAEGADVGVLGMDVPDPKGYGRMVLQGSDLLKIVEEKDADAKTKAVTVCNTGILFFKATHLFELLGELTTSNAQKEYYLTDCVEKARARKLVCKAFVSKDFDQFLGVNDRKQLAELETLINKRLLDTHMKSGVSFHLPQTSFCERAVTIGPETEVGPGFHALGTSVIGKRCKIGANVSLENAVIGDDVIVGNNCEIKNTKVAAGKTVYSGSVLGMG